MTKPEAAFLGYVLDVATRFGWRGWHVPMPVRPIPGGKMVPEKRARGLCDLILIHADPPRLILAELKRAGGGDLDDAQAEFLRLAREVALASVDDGPGHAYTVGVYLWEAQRDEDALETILRSKVMVRQ